MLQLAGPGWCLLLRPDRLRQGCPRLLAALLGDAAVVKVGLGVHEDCRRLAATWDVAVRVSEDVFGGGLGLAAACLMEVVWRRR